MLKGHLDAILLAALRGGEAHGYAIIETIRGQSGGTFDLPEGTIYPALHRLEAAGLLASRWGQSPTGRKRRIYALTPAGLAALGERQARWTAFAGAVEALLHPGDQPKP